eukprot:1503703-Pyramimonas_sp.AAC.1
MTLRSALEQERERQQHITVCRKASVHLVLTPSASSERILITPHRATNSVVWICLKRHNKM